jgi:hypothetical protein
MRVANTDGIAKFLRFCSRYYQEHESERLSKADELARKERELQEEKWKLGLA